MPEAMFQMTATATGEVRDADGNLIETVTGTETVDVPASVLATRTDDELRAAGLDDTAITKIRSTP